MGADVEDSRVRRVLATVPADTRILCVNAPDGSGSEALATRWAAAQRLSQPWAAYEQRVHQFQQASGAEVLSAPGASGHGALILRLRDRVVDQESLALFLDETLGLPIVFISSISHNGSTVLFSRPDALILLPETLFYTQDELHQIIEPETVPPGPWSTTAGWPLAVSLLEERNRPQQTQSQLTLRQCALALLEWFSGAAQDIRSVIARLAFAPGFNRDLLAELGGGNRTAGSLGSLRAMGVAQPRRHESVRSHDEWYAVPEMMADALRTQIGATDPERGLRLQRQVLECLAAVREPNLAINHAMDVDEWDMAERLIVDHWGLASADNSQAFAQSLKRFFAKRPRGPYGEFTDPQVAQLLSSAINVVEMDGHAQYHLVPAYPVVDDLGEYHLNVQHHPVAPRAPLLDLAMRMQVSRMQGRWQAAAEVATLIGERLEASELTHAPQLEHQAEHCVLWHQVGFTRLLNAEVISAESAYRRALRIAANNQFDLMTAECSGHLTLLSCLQGGEMTLSEDELSAAVPESRSSRSLQDVHRLTRGLDALWRLDRDLLRSAVRGPTQDTTDSELWPFEYFLDTMYELLFGNRSLAKQQICQQKQIMTSPEHGLLGEFFGGAEALSEQMHGSYARVIELAERTEPDMRRTLVAAKTVALIAQGDAEAARRFASSRARASDFDAQSQAMIETILAVAPSGESGEPLTADLRYRLTDDRGLFNVLPLWLLGVPPQEIQRSFGLTEAQLERITAVNRPNSEVPRALPQLTEREQEIIRALAEGASRKVLAKRLFVSVNTIKTHIAACYRKLGVSSRLDAVHEAAKRGYL